MILETISQSRQLMPKGFFGGIVATASAGHNVNCLVIFARVSTHLNNT
jgi:hypothetical protein